jgi:hypothetical protein
MAFQSGAANNGAEKRLYARFFEALSDLDFTTTPQSTAGHYGSGQSFGRFFISVHLAIGSDCDGYGYKLNGAQEPDLDNKQIAV